MCKLHKMSLPPESKLAGLYHVLARGDMVGKLIGIDDNSWRFELIGNRSDLIPENLRRIDCETFTSFEQAKIAITDED